MNKICCNCGESKPLCNFSRNSGKKKQNGLARYLNECKQCKQKKYACDLCGAHFQRRWRRSFNCCDTCYPAYRRACTLLAMAKHRAKKQQLSVEIDAKFIFYLINRGCPKTGLPFVIEKNKGRANPFSPSLDQKVPRKGYTKENTQVVCWGYNVGKAEFSEKETLDFWKRVINNAG